MVFAKPLKFTTDAATKLVPLTVRVNPAEPSVALVGEIVVMVGAGLLTAITIGVDVEFR